MSFEDESLPKRDAGAGSVANASVRNMRHAFQIIDEARAGFLS